MPEGNVDTSLDDYKSGGGSLLTLDFIRRKGLQSLGKDLAISVTPHPDFPSLFHLIPDSTTSPSEHPIVRECAYSLLIEEFEDSSKSSKDWRIVAMGYTKIDYLIDPFTLTIHYPAETNASKVGRFCWDMNSMRIFEKLDGKMAFMYYHAGCWRVSSAVTPDASESISEEQSLPKRYPSIF